MIPQSHMTVCKNWRLETQDNRETLRLSSRTTLHSSVSIAPRFYGISATLLQPPVTDFLTTSIKTWFLLKWQGMHMRTVIFSRRLSIAQSFHLIIYGWKSFKHFERITECAAYWKESLHFGGEGGEAETSNGANIIRANNVNTFGEQ